MSRALMGFAISILLMAAASPPSPTAMVWPKTLLSTRVQAWFAQQTATEDQARAFLSEHFSAAALAEASVEQRLERRRTLMARTGGLTPIAVTRADESSMDVRARDGHGAEVTVAVHAEAGPEHRIEAIRIEAGGPGGGPRASGPPLDDAEAVAKIVGALDARARADSFAGVTLLARDGKPMLYRAWGAADRAKKVPMDTAMRINLGSIGKLFTRVAVAQLAEQGKLSLDDKLSKYLPDFPHADSITVDMLAQHRSGVGDIFNARYRAMDRSKLRHNHDYLELIRDQPLWFAPGTSERYSNGGYVLLGEVIAKASGEDYYDYLDRHVFSVAGMASTGAPIEGSGAPHVARGYTNLGAPSGQLIDNVGTRPARGSAAGGSYATAADLLAFDRALTGARLCGPAWSEWVTGGDRPDTAAAARAGGSNPRAPGPVGFGFAGGQVGIASEWMHEGDLTLIVLTTRDPDVTRGTMDAVRPVFQRMKPGGGPPP